MSSRALATRLQLLVDWLIDWLINKTFWDFWLAGEFCKLKNCPAERWQKGATKVASFKHEILCGPLSFLSNRRTSSLFCYQLPRLFSPTRSCFFLSRLGFCFFCVEKSVFFVTRQLFFNFHYHITHNINSIELKIQSWEGQLTIVLGRYTEIQNKYLIFWNTDTDTDVGIRNTERYRISTVSKIPKVGSVFASRDRELYSYTTNRRVN